MKAIMLIDFGSTFTKVTGVDLDSETILGSAKSFTTVETDICFGLDKATSLLEDKIGTYHWEKKYACSSAAGGLKMIGIGLVPELTAKAAKEAALSAGAKVLKIFSMELTLEDIKEIATLKPDIILLTGGTDGGNKEIVLHNARALGGLSHDVPIIYSGNRSVRTQIESILGKHHNLLITENVMPSFGVLNIEPAREAIRKLFLERIIEAKGIKNAESRIDNVLMPTPLAVMGGAKLLADGYDKETGLGDLIVVDIGGATTDIHSVCEGLPSVPSVVLKGIEEPRVKRSVEGDLGARYSLSSALEALNINDFSQHLGVEDNVVKEISHMLEEHPYTTPDEFNEDMETIESIKVNQNLLKNFDHKVAFEVTKESIKRHAGKLKAFYTPFGISYEQYGKDLTNVNIVIGTGGPLIHSTNPKEILQAGSFLVEEPFVLKPKLQKYFLDESYILSAMGLLAEFDPPKAYRILKASIIELK